MTTGEMRKGSANPCRKGFYGLPGEGGEVGEGRGRVEELSVDDVNPTARRLVGTPHTEEWEDVLKDLGQIPIPTPAPDRSREFES